MSAPTAIPVLPELQTSATDASVESMFDTSVQYPLAPVQKLLSTVSASAFRCMGEVVRISSRATGGVGGSTVPGAGPYTARR